MALILPFASVEQIGVLNYLLLWLADLSTIFCWEEVEYNLA